MKKMMLAVMLAWTPAHAQSGFDIGRATGHWGASQFIQRPPAREHIPHPAPMVWGPGYHVPQGPQICTMVPHDVLRDGTVVARPHCNR